MVRINSLIVIQLLAFQGPSMISAMLPYIGDSEPQKLFRDRSCNGEMYELGHEYIKNFKECNMMVIDKAAPFRDYNWMFYACIIEKSLMGKALTPTSFAKMMSRNLSMGKRKEILEYVKKHEGMMMSGNDGMGTMGDMAPGEMMDTTMGAMPSMDMGMSMTTMMNMGEPMEGDMGMEMTTMMNMAMTMEGEMGMGGVGDKGMEGDMGMKEDMGMKDDMGMKEDMGMNDKMEMNMDGDMMMTTEADSMADSKRRKRMSPMRMSEDDQYISKLKKSWMLYFDAEFQVCGSKARSMCSQKTKMVKDQSKCSMEARRMSEPQYFCSKSNEMTSLPPNLKTEMQYKECVSIWNSILGVRIRNKVLLPNDLAKIHAELICYMEGTSLMKTYLFTSENHINYRTLYRRLVPNFLPPIIRQKLYAEFRSLLRSKEGIMLDQVEPFETFAKKVHMKYKFMELVRAVHTLNMEISTRKEQLAVYNTMVNGLPVALMVKYVKMAEKNLCDNM